MTEAVTETTEAPVQDTPPAEEGSGGGQWLESVPEEYRDAGFVNKYGSQEEFFRGMENLSQAVGEKGLMTPGENATEEELAAFEAGLRELSGIPGTRDDYVASINLPELGEGNMMGQFLDMGFQAGVPPKAMESLVAGLSQSVEAEEKAAMDAYDKTVKENMDALKKEWGDDYDFNVNVAERFTSELSDETIQMLKNAQWTNNAPLVRDLNALGSKFLGEGDLAQVSRAAGGADIPNMNTLVSMKEDSRYSDPDARDDNYVNEVHEYAKRLTEYMAEKR